MKKKPQDNLPTRATLLERLKDWDDRESWMDFYDTYWGLIHGVARKAGLSEEEAQDALQETAIAVAQEMKRFKYDPARGSFKSWLLQQTRWRIADQFRRRLPQAERPPADTRTTSLTDRVPDPASQQVSANLWDEEWHRNLLVVAEERVKAKVEPRTFQVYQLHVRKQWSVARVAKSLGVSHTMVYVVKHRIEAMLKREVKRLAKQQALPPIQALQTKS